jgi:hypothetical protein
MRMELARKKALSQLLKPRVRGLYVAVVIVAIGAIGEYNG